MECKFIPKRCLCVFSFEAYLNGVFQVPNERCQSSIDMGGPVSTAVG